eukprot:snap_masked-scaffold_64-processed-gene-0.86-mRNA-1 protein AED:1.00 eAED:1.00 QI:0/0/0/0/1/1/2/0/70
MLTSTTKNEVVLSISEGEYRVYDNYLSEYHSSNLSKSLTYIFTGLIDWEKDLVVSFAVVQLLAEFHFEIV